MQFTDAVTVAGTRRTADGYLVTEARCVRTGIQLYTGDEVGKPEVAVVRVLRPEGEVFKADSLRSFAHIPITNDHPAEAVTSANWRDLAVGEAGDEVLRDGQRLRIPLIVKDASAIALIEGGKRELSAGYTCTLDWTPGTTAEGDAYDAIQRNITANHVAIVARGRAGSECRIGDTEPHKWGASPLIEDKGLAPITKSKQGDNMSDALKTVVLGDKAVQVAVTDVAAIEAFKAESAKMLSDAEATHKATIAAKDADIAKRDEEIGTLKADLKKAQDAAPKPADLDKLVADRAALVTVVKAIDAKIEAKGLSDADLRKAAVAAKLGEDMVKDASEAEIAGMFKAIAKDVKAPDPLRDTMKGGLKTADAAAEVNDAYAKMVTDMQSAHRPAAA